MTNQYSAAMHYYLQAGMVCSDFFTKPVPPDVYTDQVQPDMTSATDNLQFIIPQTNSSKVTCDAKDFISVWCCYRMLIDTEVCDGVLCVM